MQVAKGDIEVGQAADKVQYVTALRNGTGLLGPGSSLLLNIMSLQGADGLQNPVVTLQGQVVLLPGFIAVGADELRKIDAHWAAAAASGATQTGPDITTAQKVLFLIDECPFDDLSGGKTVPLHTDRAASRTHATFHAIIDLSLSQLHNLLPVSRSGQELRGWGKRGILFLDTSC